MLWCWYDVLGYTGAVGAPAAGKDIDFYGGLDGSSWRKYIFDPYETKEYNK